MYIKNNITITLLGLTLLGTSCTSLRYHQPRTSEIDSSSNLTTQVDPNQLNQSSTSTAAEALDFLQRHQEPRLKLDDSDYAFIQRIHPAAQGTPEEAAFAVAVAKHSLYGDLNRKLVNTEVESNRITSFNSGSTRRAPTVTDRSVEQVANASNFGFVQALEYNMLLRSPGFSALAVHTAKNTKNSVGFNDSIRNIINQRAQVWGQINNESNTQSQQPEVITSSPNFSDPIISSSSQLDLTGDVQINTDTGLNTAADPQLDPELNQLREVNNVLDQTNDLAAQGKYNEAIQLIQSIPPSDPSYEQAQAKIRSIRSQAVRELRSKAALAYQNSLPVSDRRVKRSFLIEAQDYLQKALKLYSDDQNRQKLQSNLNVINSEIEML